MLKKYVIAPKMLFALLFITLIATTAHAQMLPGSRSQGPTQTMTGTLFQEGRDWYLDTGDAEYKLIFGPFFDRSEIRLEEGAEAEVEGVRMRDAISPTEMRIIERQRPGGIWSPENFAPWRERQREIEREREREARDNNNRGRNDNDNRGRNDNDWNRGRDNDNRGRDDNDWNRGRDNDNRGRDDNDWNRGRDNNGREWTRDRDDCSGYSCNDNDYRTAREAARDLVESLIAQHLLEALLDELQNEDDDTDWTPRRGNVYDRDRDNSRQNEIRELIQILRDEGLMEAFIEELRERDMIQEREQERRNTGRPPFPGRR